MAVKCPNYSSPDWKRLTDIFDESGLSKLAQKKSHRIFMRYEQYDDPIMMSINALNPDKYTPQKKQQTLQNVASKYEQDPKLHKYFPKGMPDKEYKSVSRILDDFEETKYRGEDTGALYADSGTDIHALFEMYAVSSTPESIKNMEQIAQRRGNALKNFIPTVTSFIESLEKTGIVLTENILGEDSLEIAGRPDIIHLRFDGKIDVYDFKTAYQTAAKRSRGDQVWNPTGDHDGYKARRYTTQTEIYGRMIERILGQPISNAYIVPIEVEFQEDNPTRDFTSVRMLEKQNTKDYGYSKAAVLADKVFGEKTRLPQPVISSVDDSSELIEQMTGIVQSVQPNLEAEAERILSMPQFHRYKGGVLHYVRNGKLYPLRSDNRQAQKQQIIDEYLKQKYSSYRDVGNLVLNYLTTGDESFIQMEGKIKENMLAILKPFVKKDNISVTTLADVKGFETKKNWVLIQQENGVSSLIYIGNEELNARFHTAQSSGFFAKINNRFSETVFANLGIDAAQAVHELGSYLKNTFADARKFEAGFIAMKLKEGNPEMTFDRVLITSFNKNSYPQAAELRDIIPIISKMGTNTHFAKFVPTNVKASLGNPALTSAQGYQPNFLKVYLDYFDQAAYIRDFRIKKGIVDYANEKIAKEDLMSMIQNQMKNTLRKGDEALAQEEGRILSEMYYQLKGTTTEVKPISWTDAKVSVPQNVANPVIQDLVKSYRKSLASLRSDFWEKYKKGFNSQLESFFRQSGTFIDKIEDRVLSQTTRYYEPLFERKNYKVQTATGVETKELNSFSLIEENSEAFNRLEPFKQEMIKSLNDKFETAAKIMGMDWKRGRVPLVRATFFNKFYRRGQNTETSYQETFAKIFENMEENFGQGERVNIDDEYSIENRFRNQYNNETYDGRKEILGLDDDTGFANLEIYNEWETNLEVVADLFMMEALRVKNMNDVAGDFNAAQSLFNWQKSALFEERIQQNINFVEWWKSAQLQNRDIDSGTLQSKMVNAANKTASIGLIAAKPSVALLSFMSQQVTSFSQAIANSFAASKEYSLGDWTKAGFMVTNPKNYEKINLLLQQYGLYNLSMSDLVNGHRRYGNKSIFRMRYLYSMMNAGDWFSRAQLLLAQMNHDGSWDAYGVKDGELIYNEDLDGRFNGDKLSPEKGKALKEAIKAQMKTDGTIGPDGKMTRAYDSNLAGRIKGQADMVIGGFDRDTRGLYSFHSLGKLLGLFKTWLPARINRGFSESYKSEIMGNYEFITDADGNTVAVWKGEQLEGMMNTLMYYFWYLGKYKESPKELTTAQQNNLRRVVGDVAMIASAFLLYGILPDDDDKTKLDDNAAFTIRRSIDDLLASYNILSLANFLYTPIAVVYAQRTLNQLFNVMTQAPDINEKTIEGLVSKVPVAGAFQEMYNMVESVEEE